jgi:hypothetical protein
MVLEKLLNETAGVEVKLYEIMDDPTSFVSISYQDQKFHVPVSVLFLVQKAVNKSVNSLLSER